MAYSSEICIRKGNRLPVVADYYESLSFFTSVYTKPAHEYVENGMAFLQAINISIFTQL